MRKPHLYFKNPVEGVVQTKIKIPNPESDGEPNSDDEPIEINEEHINSLRDQKNNLIRDRIQRTESRNTELNTPSHIEYIELEFWNVFDIKSFERKYLNDWGLQSISFIDFNYKALFAITNTSKFDKFLEDIDNYISDPQDPEKYNPNIKFIKEVKFLTSNRINQANNLEGIIHLDLIDNLNLFSQLQSILESLEDYFVENEIDATINKSLNFIELHNIERVKLEEILDNYDIINSVCSPISGIIRPTALNLPERTYGFTISNANDELPIIGIIDSGISNETPLASILVDDDDFDLTDTSPFIDNIDHGTAVGAFAALGSKLLFEFGSNIETDAHLLSMKIIDENSTSISENKVINFIREAHAKYSTKIFVLTTCYEENKKENNSVSKYAFALDKLAFELDILIFIAVGNMDIRHIYNNNGMGDDLVPYPSHLVNPESTLCIPSESYNNVSCGAIAENFESFDINMNITPSRDFSSYYSRRFHLDQNHPFFNIYRNNKHLSKPDLIFAGGDFNELIESTSSAGITTLSSSPALAFMKSIGTSFSTPLIANLAVKILKLYPELKSQSIKALLLNNTNFPNYGDLFSNCNLKEEIVTGKGIPDEVYSIYSDENQITMILEDSIQPKRMKSYSINLPEYLLDVDRKVSLLEFNVSLCFKFDPELNNQLTYCPINMSFGVFKNLPLNGEGETLNGNYANNLMLKSNLRWSEYYYWKNKMLSNSQKLSFTIPKETIRTEGNTFKLAVKCQLHKLLSNDLVVKYSTNHDFSIAISIKENSYKGEYSNKLYDEMVAINNLEVISELEADIELEN